MSILMRRSMPLGYGFIMLIVILASVVGVLAKPKKNKKKKTLPFGTETGLIICGAVVGTVLLAVAALCLASKWEQRRKRKAGAGGGSVDTEADGDDFVLGADGVKLEESRTVEPNGNVLCGRNELKTGRASNSRENVFLPPDGPPPDYSGGWNATPKLATDDKIAQVSR